MKHIYFLRGIGVGVLLTVIIFAIFGNSYKKSAAKEKTKEEETTISIIDNKKSEEATTKVENTTKAEEKTTKVEEKTTKVENTTKAEEKTTEEITKNDKVIEATIEITGENGTSEEVSRMLMDAGIIEDDIDFNAYLIDNGYASKLQKGQKLVNSGMSYEEIVSVITR